MQVLQARDAIMHVQTSAEQVVPRARRVGEESAATRGAHFPDAEDSEEQSTRWLQRVLCLCFCAARGELKAPDGGGGSDLLKLCAAYVYLLFACLPSLLVTKRCPVGLPVPVFVVKHKRRGTQLWTSFLIGTYLFIMKAAYASYTMFAFLFSSDYRCTMDLYFESRWFNLLGLATLEYPLGTLCLEVDVLYFNVGMLL